MKNVFIRRNIFTKCMNAWVYMYMSVCIWPTYKILTVSLYVINK